MYKDGHERGRQKWQCRVNELARQKSLYAQSEFAEAKQLAMRENFLNGGSEMKKARYYERKRLGFCTSCAAPSLSSSLCWSCLNDQEERRVNRIW